MQCPKCKRDTLLIDDNFNSVCEDCWRLPLFFEEKIQSLEEQNKILREVVEYCSRKDASSYFSYETMTEISIEALKQCDDL